MKLYPRLSQILERHAREGRCGRTELSGDGEQAVEALLRGTHGLDDCGGEGGDGGASRLEPQGEVESARGDEIHERDQVRSGRGGERTAAQGQLAHAIGREGGGGLGEDAGDGCGEALLVLGFVAWACGEDDGDTDRGRRLVGLENDAQAVGQGGLVDGQAEGGDSRRVEGCRRRGGWRMRCGVASRCGSSGLRGAGFPGGSGIGRSGEREGGRDAEDGEREGAEAISGEEGRAHGGGPRRAREAA